jgi:uncharacterized protein (TIGR00369 family)
MQHRTPEDLRGVRGDYLGYHVVDLKDGTSLLEWTPPEHLSNPLGIVHGGFVGVIVDDTCGTALVSTLSALQGFPTVSMQIDFMRGIPVGVMSRCEGRVLRKGRRLAVVDATITGPDEKLLTRGTCTFALGPGAGGDESAGSLRRR